MIYEVFSNTCYLDARYLLSMDMESLDLEAGRCNVHDRCEHSLTLDVPEHGTWHLQDLIGGTYFFSGV